MFIELYKDDEKRVVLANNSKRIEVLKEMGYSEEKKAKKTQSKTTRKRKSKSDDIESSEE